MIEEHDELFISGEFVRAEAKARVPVVNPATEEVIGYIPDSNEADIDRAIRAAHSALPAWAETSPKERANLLYALADEFSVRGEEIGALITLENGSPKWRSNQSASPANYRQSAKLTESLEPEEIRSAGGGQSLLRREPIGVVGAIVPWNAPQVLLALKLGPALAAGCTVVVKPSPETSLDAYILAEVLASIDLPPGVVNIVTGGRETGAMLVSNPGTNKVSFTGSTLAGRSIASTCAEQLKPVSAELGGKSAVVILADADVSKFRASIISHCLPFSGQICYSWTRVLVHESRFNEVLDCIKTTLEEAPFGDPADPSTIFGPLITAIQRDKVSNYIASGLEQGARLVLGGGARPPGFTKGYYVEPTVFVDVKPEMRIFQEEIFGPVLVVLPFADDEAAVALANNSAYGLYGAVFGEDIEHVTAIARRIEAGRIIINGASGSAGISTSGYKNSGLGREGGVNPLDNYQMVKNITLPVSTATNLA